MSQLPPDPLIGTVIGDYRIEGVLGAGAMGRVYRATRLRLGQPVALKLLEPYLASDVDFRTRFEREWRLAASLNHPNVVPIYDAGEVDGQLYLAMLPVAGGDLGQLIRSGPLAPARAIAILGQVANALDAAHSRGLVHRDVKPGNILLASGLAAEGDDHVYLADFGLTKHAGSQSRLTRVGVFVGTYAYAAPEQFGAGAVGPPADVYALGCVLYECLTGHVPFETDSDAALMRAHLYEPIPSIRGHRPELPAGLDAAIARATAKDPAGRYATARAFIADARAALAAAQGPPAAFSAGLLAPTVVPTSSTTPPPPPPSWSPPTTGPSEWRPPPGSWGSAHSATPGRSDWRRPAAVAVFVALIVVLAMIGVWLVGGNTPGNTSAPSRIAGNSLGATPPSTVIPSITASPRPTLSPVPSVLLAGRDLLFFDDMQAASGWQTGTTASWVVSQTSGLLRFQNTDPDFSVWSDRDFESTKKEVIIEADFLLSGAGGIGLLCYASDASYYGIFLNTNGQFQYIEIVGTDVQELAVHDVGLPLAPGETRRLRLECISSGDGRLRLVSYVAGHGSLPPFEQRQGPQGFDRAGIFAEALSHGITVDVDNVSAYARGSADLSTEGTSLLAHLPSWRDACLEVPATGLAKAALDCFLEGSGPGFAKYQQYSNGADMQAAYSEAKTQFPTAETESHCMTGPDSFRWQLETGGPFLGDVQCARQHVGTRIDWTDERFNILSTLVDFAGGFEAIHEAWLTAGPYEPGER